MILKSDGLLGGHWLREGDRLARLAGAVCIAAGVTLETAVDRLFALKSSDVR